ncbi:MAG TPA: flagellar biosynthesis protein FliQ [Nitrospiraceae bacterium]|nr:flagellar biosynthesis protein FliQ [Nitrospiraceae bacterium]
MTTDSVMEIGRRAIETMLLVSGPMLALSLVIGLVISALQAMTQIHEATLSFVPKLVAIFVATLLFFPWMMGSLVNFMTTLLLSIPEYAH